MALSDAGDLIKKLLGWSINHEVGKAKLGLNYQAIRVPHGLTPDAATEFKTASAIANSEKPFELGSEINRLHMAEMAETLDEEVQRQALINILWKLNIGLKLPLVERLIEALEALNVREPHPLLTPKRQTKAYTRAHCQLEALRYVEFWRAFDSSDNSKYLLDVSDAFVSKITANDTNLEARKRTVRRYKNHAVKYLGLVYVEAQLAFARNAASNGRAGHRGFIDVDQERYSKERLKAIGKRYRSLPH